MDGPASTVDYFQLINVGNDMNIATMPYYDYDIGDDIHIQRIANGLYDVFFRNILTETKQQNAKSEIVDELGGISQVIFKGYFDNTSDICGFRLVMYDKNGETLISNELLMNNSQIEDGEIIGKYSSTIVRYNIYGISKFYVLLTTPPTIGNVSIMSSFAYGNDVDNKFIHVNGVVLAKE